MKVLLEGSVSEIAAFMALGLQGGGAVAITPEPTPEPEVKPEAVVASEPQGEVEPLVPKRVPIKTPADARSLRESVLHDIVNHPGSSLNEMSARLGLVHQQVRDASRHFVERNFVRVEKDQMNTRVFRYTATKAGERHISPDPDFKDEAETTPEVVRPARDGQLKATVLGFLRENPSKTSAEIGIGIGISSKVISSTLATLKLTGILSAEGKGGNREPFRYSVAEAKAVAEAE